MQDLKLPDKIAVMVLPDCNLFPKGLLPLYIYEQRYREMLRDALKSNRMFCVGTIDPAALVKLEQGAVDADAQPPVFPFSTVGFLRACVGCKDGTSNLVLQGICRIRLTGWDTSRSYLQARPERILTRIDCEKTVQTLCLKLARLADRLIDAGLPITNQARLHLENLSDKPEDLTDFAAYNLISSAYSRQLLLGEESLEKRLEYVIAHLSNQRDALENAGNGESK